MIEKIYNFACEAVATLKTAIRRAAEILGYGMSTLVGTLIVVPAETLAAAPATSWTSLTIGAIVGVNALLVAVFFAVLMITGVMLVVRAVTHPTTIFIAGVCATVVVDAAREAYGFLAAKYYDADVAARQHISAARESVMAMFRRPLAIETIDGVVVGNESVATTSKKARKLARRQRGNRRADMPSERR